MLLHRWESGSPGLVASRAASHCSLSSTPSTRRYTRTKNELLLPQADAARPAAGALQNVQTAARRVRVRTDQRGILRGAPRQGTAAEVELVRAVRPEPAPAAADDDGGCEDATPRLDAAAERRLESVYAAYVDDAARANAGARLQESDAPPISCFGEDAFCMAHTGGSAVSGVVDYQSMATRNRLDAGPLALTPPKKPSPGLEGRYRSLARIDTSAAPAPAARSPGLELYLESRGLGAYAPRIRALGARKVADLQLLSDEDIDDLGVPKELRVVLKVSLS